MPTNGDTVRVNITSRVNQDMISRRSKNGRDQIVIRSVVARDDTVLNGILYPRDELEGAMNTLDRTPAPFGHPVDMNGAFLPASDPEAINGFYFGAYNENPRRDDNRILADKVIDVKRAEESEQGRRVLEAIEQGDPIHTSTGLYCEVDEGDEEDSTRFVARNIIFDHDAILLDEEGAITPEQGVGMLVNKKATDRYGKPVTAVYNSMMEDVEEHIDYLGVSLIQAMERREDASTWARLKSVISGFLRDEEPERKTETLSNEDHDMSEVTKEQFDKLSATVNDLAETLGKLDIEATVTNAIKPAIDKVDGLVAAQNADAEAKKTALVDRVVNKQLLTEEVAKATPPEALEAMLNAAGDGQAANLIGKFNADPKSGKPTYELPKE